MNVTVRDRVSGFGAVASDDLTLGEHSLSGSFDWHGHHVALHPGPQHLEL